MSSAQHQFRSGLLDVISSAFDSSAPPGTVRKYEVVLKSIAPKISPKLGSVVVFHVKGESSFFTFFGSVLLVCPRSSESSSGDMLPDG